MKNNILKSISKWSFITLLFLLNAFLLYYVVVNTLLKNTVLQNISFNGDTIGFIKKENLQTVLGVTTKDLGLDKINVSIDNQWFTIPVNDLEITYPIDDALSYGKGYDIIKVIQEGFSTISGVNIEKEYTLDVSAILDSSPINFSSNNPSKIENQVITCNNDNYNLTINLDYLENKTLEALKNKSPLILNSKNLVKYTDDYKIIEYCNAQVKESSILKEELKDFVLQTNTSFDEVYTFMLLPDGTTDWHINNNSYLESALIKYNLSIKTDPVVNDYKRNGYDIYLFGDYKYGSEINIQKSILAFEEWEMANDPLIIMKSVTEPSFSGRNIYDFSNIIARGQTRMKLSVDGVSNPSLPNAEGGLSIIDDVLIMPYEQFSYIETINNKQKYALEKYNIGYGTCNSTTTLFRAALEAGFPIDERQSHSFLVESYGWGYPYNFVDAAYFPNPKVDLKFTNDYAYPVLLNFKFSHNSGYQYHIVEVRTSKYVQERDVELTNWNYVRKYSDKTFTGEFTRSVKDKNGDFIRVDTFRSSYH